jgi:hypothetical protein
VFLIRNPDGSAMLVESLAGHAGCTVLDANAQAMTLADAKQMKCEAVETYLASQILRGFTPTTGPLAGHTLQTRDNTDRTNWLTSQAAYSAQVAAGNGAVLGAKFRTAENDTVACSFSDGLNALLMMAAWGAALFGKSWTVKDRINALTTVADVLAYDVASGWEAA